MRTLLICFVQIFGWQVIAAQAVAPDIVVSFSVVQDIVREIVPEKLVVASLVPRGISPHDYELRAGNELLSKCKMKLKINSKTIMPGHVIIRVINTGNIHAVRGQVIFKLSEEGI